jgi:uncharacterized protein with PIN domain
MAVFDAAPLVGLLLDEPGADAIIDALTRADQLAVSAVNYAEVIDRVARVSGVPPRAVEEALQVWIDVGMAVVPVTASAASRAAALRVANYHHRTAAVSIADCCAIELALDLNDALATSDRELVRLARQVGVEVIALPDSRGRLPD